MTDKQAFLIARSGSHFVRYELDLSSEVPQLYKSEVDSVPTDEQHLLSPLEIGDGSNPRASWRRYTTVINSVKSGTGTSSNWYFNILLPLFKDFGMNHVYISTYSQSTIAQNAADFQSSAMVVIFGGDTAVSEFINNLPLLERPLQMQLAVIPTGTGNALANSVGLSSPQKAIASLFLKEESFHPLSSFPIEFPDGQQLHSLVVASWGLHASLVADSDDPEMRKLGAKRFRVAGEKLAKENPVYKGKIDHLPMLEHSYFLVTGVRELEACFLISPYGDPPSSNKLFYVHIPWTTSDKFMQIMAEAYNKGNHIHCPDVDYKQISTELEVDIYDQPAALRRWCVDGKIVVSPPGKTKIGTASCNCRGWELYLWI